jgi:hypothetical protein
MQLKIVIKVPDFVITDLASLQLIVERAYFALMTRVLFVLRLLILHIVIPNVLLHSLALKTHVFARQLTATRPLIAKTRATIVILKRVLALSVTTLRLVLTAISVILLVGHVSLRPALRVRV